MMAWGSPDVTSWYKNAVGRVSQNWPFPLVDYWNATVAPNPDDFVLGAARHGGGLRQRRTSGAYGLRSATPPPSS